MTRVGSQRHNKKKSNPLHGTWITLNPFFYFALYVYDEEKCGIFHKFFVSPA